MSNFNCISPADIRTLFLDAGNTLICMDFDWVASELRRCGLDCDAASLRRSEARARPSVSRFVHENRNSDQNAQFEFYLVTIAEGLPGARSLGKDRLAEIGRQAALELKQPGQDFRLWSSVLPGVDEALTAFKRMGLKLVVVSNSDGSVERALTELGLAARVDAILDSTVVGYEKPDPRFFEHALEVAGARREQTVHVGDMYYQDIHGARAAGLAAVLLDPHGDWEVDDCMRCRTLGDVAAWIKLGGGRFGS